MADITTILAQNTPDYSATILAVATLVTALAAAISSFLNRGANARTEKKTEETAAKVDVVAAHVNSKATADNAKIEALQKQNADLLVLLAERKETASLLAQSAAIVASAPASLPQAAPAAPTEVVVVNEPHDPVPTTATKPPK